MVIEPLFLFCTNLMVTTISRLLQTLLFLLNCAYYWWSSTLWYWYHLLLRTRDKIATVIFYVILILYYTELQQKCTQPSLWMKYFKFHMILKGMICCDKHMMTNKSDNNRYWIPSVNYISSMYAIKLVQTIMLYLMELCFLKCQTL